MKKSKVKRVVDLKVLPGEPLNGGGRMCIHLFVQDEVHGKFTEPHALHPALDEEGQPIKQKVTARPTLGRLACDPNRNPGPRVVRGVTYVTIRTDDPRAVTCPKCLASADYKQMMSNYESGG